MEKQWFYGTPEKKQGPIKQSTLVAMARNRTLPPTTLVFTEGMQRWVPAGKLPFLFAQQPTSSGDDGALNLLLPLGPQSGWAIASGYLGILALAPVLALITGPLSITFAVLGMRDLRRNPQKRGLGRCITGIVLSSIGLVLTAAILLVRK